MHQKIQTLYFPKIQKFGISLGFKGSYISDLFFQSLGLISMLIATTLFFTGINITRSKKDFSL